MDLISEHGIFLFAYDFSMEMLTKKRKKRIHLYCLNRFTKNYINHAFTQQQFTYLKICIS